MRGEQSPSSTSRQQRQLAWVRFVIALNKATRNKEQDNAPDNTSGNRPDQPVEGGA